MFLTVKEASDLTGKSATTIYRLCNKRRNSSFIKKEDNKFFIDKEFLLATYPEEEKRITEIIENGSKEFGDPIFLEIEPKQLEKHVEEQNDTENINISDDIISSETFLKSKDNLENSEIEPEKIQNTQAIESSDLKDNGVIDTPAQIPFYRKDEFWERFIVLSVLISTLVALIVLFYFSAN